MLKVALQFYGCCWLLVLDVSDAAGFILKPSGVLVDLTVSLISRVSLVDEAALESDG